MKAKILIVGIPGTGKTEIGNILGQEKQYLHIDLEEQQNLNSLSQHPNRFIKQLINNHRDTVVTWGFLPDNTCIDIVLAFRNQGFKVIWFDGDRLAARKAFNLRATVSEQLFDLQLERIDHSDVISRISPIVYNTFDNEGKFKEHSKIIEDLILLI